MSKSLKRVLAHADALGLEIEPVHLPQGTLTAQAAADACKCDVDQIIKSILFRIEGQDTHVLFLTAGGNRVSQGKAEKAAGKPLTKADAASIRAYTGFAIGGVSPLGHLNPVETFMDPHILTFDRIWAAAGTPHHVFEVAPDILKDALQPTIVDFTE